MWRVLTPTPTSPEITPSDRLALGDDVGWHSVDVELLIGPKGRAAIVEIAAEKPLRVRWVCGGRVFKRVETARAFAKSVVGLGGSEIGEA
jgi:hypothetical protein